MDPIPGNDRFASVEFSVQLAAKVSEVRESFDVGLAGLRQEMSSGFQRLERKIDLILDKLL